MCHSGLVRGGRVALCILTFGASFACGSRTGLEALEDVAQDEAPPDARPPFDGGRDARADAIADATLDTSRPFDGGVPPVSICTPPDAGIVGAMCSRTVLVTTLNRSNPVCFVDAVVGVGQTGTLSYPCVGDGPATISFGTRSFTGADIGNVVDVCTGTEFPWSDGCMWTSAQRVTGALDSGTLTFTYGEAPKAGQTGCTWSCSAEGTLTLQ
jgi:hypothetical protein